jgi:GeoRSP system PqqD family protein
MTRVWRNDEVLWREEQEAQQEAHGKLAEGEDIADLGTAILFSGGQIVGLNLLGTEIWKLCDGRNVEEIVTELLDQFDVAEAVLRADVDGFLAELAGKGFVRYGE